MRRAARVLPAYWVTLAVVVLVSQPAARTALAQALAVQTYLSDSRHPVVLAVVEHPDRAPFYIVLPFVVWLLERVRRRRPDLPVQLLVVSAVRRRWPSPWYRWARSARTCSSSAGCREVAQLRGGDGARRAGAEPGSGPARAARRIARDSVGCLLVAAAALLLATTPIAGPLTLGLASGTQLSVRLALSTVVAGFLLAPLVLGRDDAYSAALGSRPARNVGAVSFGLFLWHLPVFSAIYAVTGARSSRAASSPCSPSGCPSVCSWRG